jgi:FkbM family methyltransferase
MIRVGGVPYGAAGDTVFYGLIYPDGDEISKHMDERLRVEPFYQSDKFDVAMRAVKQWRCAVDCGAWVGGWSRALSKRFDRVVAIEANPDNARCVRKNTPSHVTVVGAAVGDTSGRVTLAETPHAPNVATFIGAGTRLIPMWRLDDLPTVQECPAIDYLKIHVNGMELKTLRGAVQTIKKHRPILTVVLKMAIEDFGDSADSAREFLRNELKYCNLGGERPYEVWGPA